MMCLRSAPLQQASRTRTEMMCLRSGKLMNQIDVNDPSLFFTHSLSPPSLGLSTTVPAPSTSPDSAHTAIAATPQSVPQPARRTWKEMMCLRSAPLQPAHRTRTEMMCLTSDGFQISTVQLRKCDPVGEKKK